MNRIESREREERRRNIVINGVEVNNGRRREAVEEIMRLIGVKVEIQEIRRIGGREEKGKGEMLLVRLKNKEQRWEVMGGKRNLRGRRERIWEDLSFREKKIRWKLGRIARREEEMESRAWVSGGKIRIEWKWWMWDERREELIDEKGKVRKEEGIKEQKGGREEGR